MKLNPFRPLNPQKMIREADLKHDAVQQLEDALLEALETMRVVFPSLQITRHEALDLIWMLIATTDMMAKHKDTLNILCEPKERLRIYQTLAERHTNTQTLEPKVKL